jgi:CheY-like chemotaxis protein
VQVKLGRVQAHIEIVVSDTGVGISPDFLPYVFDRFRQADSSSTRRHSGLGLGLAIVRHLTELHGGSIHVSSEGEGQGTTFVVKLPLMVSQTTARNNDCAHPAVEEKALTADCPPQLGGVRALVVDDDADSREVVAAILAQCEVEVRTAASASEALAILTAWRPDVLVSDIEMPEANGYALIQRVRTLEPEDGGRIPAVALTAYTRIEDRLRALAAGFQMHVPKPVDPAELVTIVASLAGRLGQKRVGQTI